MSSDGTISIPVDVMNPGQFFACCGLFELAERLWCDADLLAHFNDHGFHLTQRNPDRTFSSLLSEFAAAECEQLDPADNASSSLWLGVPFKLRLDWWIKSENNRIDLGGGGQLKTWAGKQLGPVIFRSMKVAAGNAARDASPLDYAAPVFDGSAGKANKKAISPFYFDSRREGTSLDLGFSPDEQNMSVDSYPVVESLALVGLQRFRPLADDTTHPRSFVYNCWTNPLPASVAPLAACGLLSTDRFGTFRFVKPSRGGEYMTMFSRATRERSGNA